MTTPTKPKAKRGLALLSPAQRVEIARKGGKKAQELGRAHRFTPTEAKAAAAKSVASRRAKAKPTLKKAA